MRLSFQEGEREAHSAALPTRSSALGKRTKPNGTRRTIKLGSYSAVERLIRVHPVLDKPWVPCHRSPYILYHEMLHHVIPASQGTGRRMLHPPLFVARERLFRDYDRSLTWERGHVARLLRAGRRQPRDSLFAAWAGAPVTW